MHSEGWIFDVEMLILAELASIPVAEDPIGWHEVKGSKLNVLWDSLGMAWGLAVKIDMLYTSYIEPRITMSLSMKQDYHCRWFYPAREGVC